MLPCPACGAAAPAESPCPRCGEYVAGADTPDVLELAAEPRARRATGSVDEPSPAQIGGAEGEPALDVEPTPRRTPRATGELAPTATGSYADQERERRTLFWRATRIPVLVILGWFTLSHLAFDSTWVFLDNVDLLLHEAGHLLWGWDGITMAALGGTLGQLMWPVIFAAYFYHWRPDRFAMLCCVWWFGQNFMSISRYMNDAAVMQLPLVGGDQHDWNFLFRRWGVLPKTNEIASFFHSLGALIMIGSLGWLIWRTVHPDRGVIDGLD